MIMSVPAKIDLIYKLDDVDANEGVDLFDIAPILMSFGDLIRSANSVLGGEQEIEVKVKPFREGSWITEFIIYGKDVGNVLVNPYSVGAEALLAFLGITPQKALKGVAGIVRFTKGKVNNFTKSEDKDTVTYKNDDGESLEVSQAEHRLVQSPLIQTGYYESVITPLEKFPTANSVSIGLEEQELEKFTAADKPFFKEYLDTELLEDVEENVSTLRGVYLKPKRGPYSGNEQDYSFIMGENNVLWPVTIEDGNFLGKLKSGEIRPYSQDVLKVNLEIHQKRDSTNKVITNYSVIEVLEYIQYEKPHQLKLELSDNDE
ncbi:MAG: hypothetical protein WDN66_02690 [Candidatus Saccharibacteria bacterium]